MTKLKKMDYVILAVLLALVIGIVCIVLRGTNQSNAGTVSSGSEKTSTVKVEDRPFSYYANDKKIGAITGGLYEVMILERFPDAEVLQFNNQPDMAVALSAGIIDAFTCPESSAKDFVKADSSLTYLNEVFMEIPYGFAFQKSADKEYLRNQMNEFLQKIRSDGTYDNLVSVWFGEDESQKIVDSSGLTGENGTLQYITAATMQPFSYIANGTNAGLEIDLVTRFCREYGYDLKIDDAEFASLIPGITSGKYDIASGTIMITEERAQSVNFSDVYYTANAVSVVRKEADTSAAPALKSYDGRKIGVQTGTVFDKMILAALPDSEISYYNSYTDMLSALKAGMIDGFAADEPMIKYMMNEDNAVSYLPEKFDSYSFGFAFSKDTQGTALCEEFSEYVRKARTDGTFNQLDEIWFGTDDSRKIIPDFAKFPAEKGVLTLAVEAANAPFVYIKDNTIVGYEIDLACRFCQENGYGLELIDMNFDSIIPAVSSGKYDFGASTITITEERRESVNFSEPHYDGGSVLAVRAEDLQAVSTIQQEENFWIKLKTSFEKNFIRENRYELILEGIGTTCLITVLTVIFGSVLAFLLCLFRRTDSLLAGKIADIYVKLLQGTPMVVLLMILYYIILGKSGIPAVWIAVIGFSLNFAAYTSETLRSGIESIDGGQREAALALGYSENQAFFRFIFPQAAIRQLSVYRGEIISLLKNTSIVGYIAIQDLTKMSDIIRSRTYEAFFPLIVTAIIYFILAWIISLILKIVLKQIDPRERKRTVKGVKAE